MGRVEKYRQIVEKALSDYASNLYAHSDIQSQTIFDRKGDITCWCLHKKFVTVHSPNLAKVKKRTF